MDGSSDFPCKSWILLSVQWEFGIKSTQLWDTAWPGDSRALLLFFQGPGGKNSVLSIP